MSRQIGNYLVGLSRQIAFPFLGVLPFMTFLFIWYFFFCYHFEKRFPCFSYCFLCFWGFWFCAGFSVVQVIQAFDFRIFVFCAIYQCWVIIARGEEVINKPTTSKIMQGKMKLSNSSPNSRLQSGTRSWLCFTPVTRTRRTRTTRRRTTPKYTGRECSKDQKFSK